MLVNINQSNRFKGYQEIIKKSEAFKKGIQDFKDNKVDLHIKQDYLWVKKHITKQEWNKYYSSVSDYYFIGNDNTGVWIGFLIPNFTGELPFGCELCTDEELLQMDNYRRAINLRPFPYRKSDE